MTDLDLLKKEINIHLEDGEKLEKMCRNFNFSIPGATLEGFRSGLKAVLSWIDQLKECKHEYIAVFEGEYFDKKRAIALCKWCGEKPKVTQ